jgi:hypothetical protein
MGMSGLNPAMKTCGGPRVVGMCAIDEGGPYCMAFTPPWIDGVCDGTVTDTVSQ